MKFFFWLLTVIVAILAGIYFSGLNPGPIKLRLSRNYTTEIIPIHLLLVCIGAGAIAVLMLLGVREVRGIILNWRSTRRRKREEKVHGYYVDGALASLSRRTGEAISLLQKVLALEPNHTRALMSLGNIFRREKHYTEAIRLHRKARQLEEGNLEVLLTLARDLEEAKRFEEALQTLDEVLRIDGTNPTALYRIRDIHLRTEKWAAAHAVQERLLKAGLPDREMRMEIQMMAGLKYEIGREHMERGEREHARRNFKDAIKLDKTFLSARIGFGETLIGEGKLREAAEMWEKSYLKTGHSIFLYRLEDLYLEIGEPGEMIRIYQQALARQGHNAQLKMALGKLYYRLEMVDDAFELLSTLDGVHDPTGDVSKIMASLYIRKGNTEAALMEVLGDSRPGLPSLNCAACDYHTREWSGRCPACGRWNTLAVMAPRAAGEHSLAKGPDLSPTSSYPGVPAPFEIV